MEKSDFKKQVNLGYATNEPSLEFIIFFYYSKYMSEKDAENTAKQLIAKLCEE